MDATQTIKQLGGNGIFSFAFAGAVVGPDSLTLKIAPALVKGTKGKATHVVVKLDASDTYRVEVLKVTRRGLNVETMSALDMVHDTELRAVVEGMTGLRMGF